METVDSAEYKIEEGYGIYTDMNAIRADEELDNLHLLMWISGLGIAINEKDRNIAFLKQIVQRIYAAMLRTEYMVFELFPEIKPQLPHEIKFIHAEELCKCIPIKILKNAKMP